MNNPINALKAQRERLERKEAALLARVETLIADLTDAVGEQLISAVSDITNLEQYGEFEWTYGRLHFGDGRLSVQYRYSGDDHEADYHRDDEGERPWRSVTLTECSPVWREKLMADIVLASLFSEIGAELGKREEQIDGSLAAVQKVIEAEAATIDAAMSASIGAFGNATLAADWHRSLTSLSLDTADAQARVYTLFETLCLAILDARGVAPLNNRVLRYALPACITELTSGEPELARDGTRQILSAVNGIGTGIGTLRNSFSTAHGTSPGAVLLNPAYAMLAKNAVATAAIFLLSRHQANPPAPRSDDASASSSDQSPAP
ncbi:abortive infection family protein [Burkholderia vietnamiensis]|uniref:abortive infection family protein n=1 Tax=Burkholderia vietnamiensis TaxID=60552 RepID=UPI001B9F2DB3|nr:abortive infection family protein [Burkholderia vietnamiensis]MBR8282535.1 abortive infection family protein [Burkholderia vietnamiensis]